MEVMDTRNKDAYQENSSVLAAPSVGLEAGVANSGRLTADAPATVRCAPLPDRSPTSEFSTPNAAVVPAGTKMSYRIGDCGFRNHPAIDE